MSDSRLDAFADRLTASKVDLKAICSAALAAYAEVIDHMHSHYLIGQNNEVRVYSAATTGYHNQCQISIIPSAMDLESFDIDSFVVKYIHPATRLLCEKIPPGRWDYVAIETPGGCQSEVGQINLPFGGAAAMRVVLAEVPIEDESIAPADAVYTNPQFYDINDDMRKECRVARVLRFDVRIVPSQSFTIARRP